MRAADGSVRDTAVYSVTAAEWPAVRAHLDWQLNKPREVTEQRLNSAAPTTQGDPVAKKKNITIEELWQVERLGAPSLAPDGAQAVASLTRYLDGREQGQLVAVAACPRWEASRVA